MDRLREYLNDLGVSTLMLRWRGLLLAGVPGNGESIRFQGHYADGRFVTVDLHADDFVRVVDAALELP